VWQISTVSHQYLDNRKSKIAYKKGWQLERMLNFDSYMTNGAKEGQENMVADGWTEMPAFSAVIGSPAAATLVPTPEEIGKHVGRLYLLDLPSREAVRARADSIVQNPETAAKLKPWYPTWYAIPHAFCHKKHSANIWIHLGANDRASAMSTSRPSTCPTSTSWTRTEKASIRQHQPAWWWPERSTPWTCWSSARAT
jgi:hypothetical protein